MPDASTTASTAASTDYSAQLSQMQSTLDAIQQQGADNASVMDTIVDNQGSILDAINNLDLSVVLEDGTQLSQLLGYGDLLLVLISVLLILGLGMFLGYQIVRMWKPWNR